MYQNYVFDFERLLVYQKALDFSNQIYSITLKFRKELQYSIGDQFRRATLSICNNLAEGSRKTEKSRRQFFEYALDSARECIPMISLAVRQQEIAKVEEMELRDQCIQICNMLHKLIQSV